MPSPLPRRSPPPSRSSGGEHVFADDAGRLWSAALQPAARAPSSTGPAVGAACGRAAGATRPALALVYVCLSDARQPIRAIAVDPARLRAGDAGDDDLRRWLREAPAMGRLS
jgi:hypothetical protein